MRVGALFLMLLLMEAGIVGAYPITVDGDPSDWPSELDIQNSGISPGESGYVNGVWVFHDLSDDLNQYGGDNPGYDIKYFMITFDDTYAFFLMVLNSPAVFDSPESPLVIIALGNEQYQGGKNGFDPTIYTGSGAPWNPLGSDVQTSKVWQREIVVNLSRISGNSIISGSNAAFWVYNSVSEGNVNSSNDLAAVNYDNGVVELRVRRDELYLQPGSGVNSFYPYALIANRTKYGTEWYTQYYYLAMDVMSNVTTDDEVGDGKIDYSPAVDVSQVPFFGGDLSRAALVVLLVVGAILLFGRR
ncbi:hypothetical protein GQS_06050 [Thermococcus sp. 4557]|nr:hypothetical protein GQS_06050 [Thermococcus sp. 4557]